MSTDWGSPRLAANSALRFSALFTPKQRSCAEPLYLGRPPIEHPPLLVSAQMTATGRRRHPTQVFSRVAVYTVMFLPSPKECLDFRNIKCLTLGHRNKKTPCRCRQAFHRSCRYELKSSLMKFLPLLPLSSVISFLAKSRETPRRQEPWLAERGTIDQDRPGHPELVKVSA